MVKRTTRDVITIIKRTSEQIGVCMCSDRCDVVWKDRPRICGVEGGTERATFIIREDEKAVGFLFCFKWCFVMVTSTICCRIVEGASDRTEDFMPFVRLS